MGATYLKADFARKNEVRIRYKLWTITLDTYNSAWGREDDPYWTRMRAPYVSRDGFRFEIYPTGFMAALVWTGIGTWLRLKKVNSGFPQMAEKLQVRANNEQKLRALLSNPRIRQLLDQDNTIHLLTKRQRSWFFALTSRSIYELYYDCPSVIVDLERLTFLYRIFAEMLDQLSEIGSSSTRMTEGPQL